MKDEKNNDEDPSWYDIIVYSFLGYFLIGPMFALAIFLVILLLLWGSE